MFLKDEFAGTDPDISLRKYQRTPDHDLVRVHLQGFDIVAAAVVKEFGRHLIRIAGGVCVFVFIPDQLHAADPNLARGHPRDTVEQSFREPLRHADGGIAFLLGKVSDLVDQ